MDKIYLKAYAKINLSLDVIGKRDDGYHDLKMIMQTVNLYDDLIIKVRDEGISLKCNVPYIPVDQKNIAFAVAQSIIKRFNINTGVDIEIIKRIPVSAGLGGGSSDAGAVLVGLNKLFDLKMTKEELMEIGKEFGADIPFCILGGTVLAEGIGEKLTQLPSLPKLTLLICKPGFHISTAYVYSRLDCNKISKHPDTQMLINLVKNKNINMLAKNMVNVLEPITSSKYPVIKDIKNIMMEFGALGSLMSGSGTSVFGIFKTKYDALLAEKRLAKICKEIFVTNTLNFDN